MLREGDMVFPQGSGPRLVRQYQLVNTEVIIYIRMTLYGPRMLYLGIYVKQQRKKATNLKVRGRSWREDREGRNGVIIFNFKK